jgi:hypothetical protein
VDQISDPSGEGLLKIVKGLKRAHRLEVPIDVQLSEELFLLGKTVREGKGYKIYISEAEPYPLLHEFYHVLAEERVLKRHIGSSCGFCTKIALEMMNALVDLAIERIIHQTNPDLFPHYYPRIKENLDLMGRCGIFSFDPTRTLAYNLYLEAAIGELYPKLREEYRFWELIELPRDLERGGKSALDMVRRFAKEGRLSWRDISGTAVDLSWDLFEADLMFLESPWEFRIVCNTDHSRSRRIVSELMSSLKSLSQEWPQRS